MKLRSGILKKGSYGAYTPSEPSSSHSTPIQPSTGQETPVFGLGGAKPPPRSRVPKILTQETGKTFPRVQLHDICLRVITLAQTLSGHKFYPYQVKVAYRAVQSILLRDGATITSLLSRQSGKSDVVACTIAALAVLLPYLSKIFYWDWRFNLTDEEGRYRGFAHGLLVGIYAPKADQAVIIFNRVKQYLETPSAKRVFSELKISFDTFNGETCRLSNGSRVMCQTASDTSKNEGETHHILVLEESQDIGELKIRKSLYPMVSSTKGTIWMIGTSSTKKCVFYEEIRANEREQMNGGQMNHFFFPHQIVEQYNSLYRDFVKLMKVKLGEFSDEFRMAFRCLSGSTDVILANGEVKQLKDMRVGDYVISHTGAHRRVQKVKNMGVKDTLRLSFYGAPDVVSTPDHRFLTTDGWVQAQDLTKKHRLLVPRIQSLNADVFSQKTTKRQQVYLDQGYMLRRLKGIAQAGKEEVWDIEVAHDHSFCTRSVVAHNCEWIFERGMFVTQDALLHQQVAAQSGEPWSELLIPEEVGRLFGPGYKFVAGIDWGRDNDSTVVAVSAVDWNNPVLTLASNQVAGMASVCLYRRHLVSLMEWRGDNYEVQFAEINAYLSRFGPRLRRVVTDANTVGKAIFDRLTAVYDGTGVEIMPCTFSAKAKSDLYKAFYAELCGHRLTFPYSQKARAHRCVRKFVDEMLDLRKDYSGGTMKVAHPNAKGAHDDYPDAVALSCWGTLIEQDSYELDCASSNPFYLP